MRRLLIIGMTLGLTGCDGIGSSDCSSPQWKGNVVLDSPGDLCGWGSVSVSMLTIRSVSDLSELSCVCTVQNWVYITESNLTDLSGLDVEIGTSLFIDSNPVLTSLEGINQPSFPDELGIYSNPMLTDLRGLEGVTSVGMVYGSGLIINGNSSLQSLSGLEDLTEVSSLFISGNPLLTDLSGLYGITTITGNVDIRLNDNLTVEEIETLLYDVIGEENIGGEITIQTD